MDAMIAVTFGVLALVSAGALVLVAIVCVALCRAAGKGAESAAAERAGLLALMKSMLDAAVTPPHEQQARIIEEYQARQADASAANSSPRAGAGFPAPHVIPDGDSETQDFYIPDGSSSSGSGQI